MRVRVLGSAAGGAFPQWNCSCRNCNGIRNGTLRSAPRSQAQLAVSADSSAWFLLNASPDLRTQIESFPALHPAAESLRHSPIHGVLLTTAELDAALGLLLLRESQPTVVYATASVKQLLIEDNSIFAVLRRQPDQVRWHAIKPGEAFPLTAMQGQPTGITCLPVSTGAAFPSFLSPDRASQLNRQDAVLGLFLRHETASGTKQIAFFPGLAELSPDWLAQMQQCDAVFIDGTFWSDDELIQIQGSGKTAREMGHSPLGEPGGTLDQLSSLKGPRKIFIHINNTNPILDEDSPEHRRILTEGWELAYDGMELEL